MRYKLKEKDNIYSNDDFGRYIPAYYNEISGSANTGNLLAQIKYWWEKNGKKEFFLPIQRIAWQIGVSYKKARTAAERLVELGFIKTVSRQCGYAPKITHWTFCEEAVDHAISQYKSSRYVKPYGDQHKMTWWIFEESTVNNASLNLPSNAMEDDNNE